MNNHIISLYDACRERNIDLIKILLKDCNKIDEKAYFLICSNGDYEILELFFDNIKYTNKLDIHCNNEYSLKIACKNNDLQTVKYLIEYGENNNNRFDIHVNNDEIMKNLCESNYFDIIKYLIEFGYKCNKPFLFNIENDNIIYYACKSNSLELIKYLIEYVPFDTIIYNEIFINACRYSCVEIIEYLLYSDKLKIDINYKRNNAISIACTRNDSCIIQCLYDYYKKINKIHIITSTNTIKNICSYGNSNVFNWYCNTIEGIECIINRDQNVCIDLFISICISRNIELIQFFIDNKYKHFSSRYIIHMILYQPVIYNDTTVVEYLLDYFTLNYSEDIDKIKLFINACKGGNLYLAKLFSKQLITNSDILDNNNLKPIETLLHVCSNGDSEMFIFLIDYYRQLNLTIDIYAYNFKLLTNAFQNKHVDIIKFLMYYDIQKTNNILQYIIDNIIDYENLLFYVCSSNNILPLQFLINYCFIYNISIDLSMYEYRLFHFAYRSSNYDMIKYMIYLSKHNYNRKQKKLNIIYPSIYTYTDEYSIKQLITHYPELLYTKKYVNINFKNYKISHLYVVNNNLINFIHPNLYEYDVNYALLI